MGIYTSRPGNYYTSSHYTEVEPYHGDHFNYHELGIIAATESAANQNAFMKAIALGELTSVEQYGSEQVFYENVNIKGIFEKIKAFFKKIIEKIHKIFHTFIAKMSSWFGNNKDFVKKYEKEIVKNWGLIKNDWEFKGYKYTCIVKQKIADTTTYRNRFKNGSSELVDLLSSDPGTNLKTALEKMSKQTGKNDSDADVATKKKAMDDAKKAYDADTSDESLKQAWETAKKAYEEEKGGLAANDSAEMKNLREHMEEFREGVRKNIIDTLNNSNSYGKTILDTLSTEFDIKATSGGLDSKEYTEELHKVFRHGEDSKEDLKKSDITGIEAYGGSVSGMLSFIKEFDKIKESLEKVERAYTKSVDELIDKMNKAENELLKEKDAAKKTSNEGIVQVSSLFQSIWGSIKEIELQAFSASLEALKDCAAQAKEIAVKVVGLNKEMTEESYNYGSNYSGGYNGSSFLESVKLV